MSAGSGGEAVARRGLSTRNTMLAVFCIVLATGLIGIAGLARMAESEADWAAAVGGWPLGFGLGLLAQRWVSENRVRRTGYVLICLALFSQLSTLFVGFPALGISGGVLMMSSFGVVAAWGWRRRGFWERRRDEAKVAHHEV